jgi:glycosyltransferase involved in cell wall biosynthesis
MLLFLSMSSLSPLSALDVGASSLEVQEDCLDCLKRIQDPMGIFGQEQDPFLPESLLQKLSTSKTKKVLFILPHYLGGGMGTAFVALLNNFPNRKIQIDVCVLKQTGSKYSGITRENIRYISYSEARKNKYEAVVSYAQWTSLSLWVNKIHSKKRIQWIHNDGTDEKWRQRLKQNKESMQKIDAFVLVSEAAKQNFVQFFPEYAAKTHAIYNIIDNAYIKKASFSKQNTIVSNKKILNVVSVGRYTLNKNFDTAIKVHALLEKKGIHFRWYILGYGDEEQNLKALIKQYGLVNKFIIAGFKKNPYPYIKAADVFVHIPRIEAFGLVVTEAKILQRPILVSNFPAVFEQIENGKTGIIVENTLEAISDGLERLLLDKSLRRQFSSALKGYAFDNKGVKEELTHIFFDAPR